MSWRRRLGLRYVDLGVRADASATEGDYPDGADAEGKQAETGRLRCCDDFAGGKKPGVRAGIAGVRPGAGKSRTFIG